MRPIERGRVGALVQLVRRLPPVEQREAVRRRVVRDDDADAVALVIHGRLGQGDVGEIHRGGDELLPRHPTGRGDA
jgi:hypothetical protein